MKEFEREEISKLPVKYQPLSPIAYVGYLILFALPTVGLICLIIFGFNDDNIARRNLARAFLIADTIGLLIAIIAIVIIVGVIGIIGGAV